MVRMRRLRVNETMRAMVRETSLQVSDLIYPIFVMDGTNQKTEVTSMPGIFKYSVDRLQEELDRVIQSGVSSILLFGVPKHKDEMASEAYQKNGVTQRAIRLIKEKYPSILVVADVCLCEYTSHGHCGVVKDGKILNDETLPLLCKTAVSLAEAGADVIAPSDMMDGRVEAIRKALDENGFSEIAIMAYSAKYASAYYGPFRDAANSAPCFGDRRTYQMDYANIRQAVREMESDILEGADMIMVKPALAFLDVVKEARQRFDLPIVTYNVSGEYSMVKAAAKNGWIDEKRIVLENLTGMKRAGADIMITYHALDAAKWIKEG